MSTNANISIATCAGCRQAVLIWPASPSAICHSCNLQQQLLQNKREQNRLDKWRSVEVI